MSLLLLEEPNWWGTVERYGSASRLAEQLDEVRALIVEADPDALARSVQEPLPEHDVLAKAWQASEVVARLCTVAISNHLPLWRSS